MKSYFLLLLIAATPSFGADSAPIESFFGAYRTRVYNGHENQYSNRFFYPSINTEPSVKLKHVDGRPFQTFNFNFEVPIEKPDGSIFLKFLFLEFPLDGAEFTSNEQMLRLRFEGEALERISSELGEFWPRCKIRYEASLSRENQGFLRIELSKIAESPCKSERHSILVEKVKELP
jgi:hypothetical protein